MKEKISQLLQEELSRTGMSRRQLSKKSGVPWTTVSQAVSGKQEPAAMTLIRLCQALGTPIGKLQDIISNEAK